MDLRNKNQFTGQSNPGSLFILTVLLVKKYFIYLDTTHFVIKMEVKVDTLEFQIQHYA